MTFKQIQQDASKPMMKLASCHRVDYLVRGFLLAFNIIHGHCICLVDLISATKRVPALIHWPEHNLNASPKAMYELRSHTDVNEAYIHSKMVAWLWLYFGEQMLDRKGGFKKLHSDTLRLHLNRGKCKRGLGICQLAYNSSRLRQLVLPSTSRVRQQVIKQDLKSPGGRRWR